MIPPTPHSTPNGLQWGASPVTGQGFENNSVTTPSHSHPPEYLDPAVLDLRLREIPRPVLSEIIAVFSQETQERIPRMRAMFQAGDWKGLGDQAHALKGSAGHFGLPLLSARAREIELAAKAGDEAAAGPAVAGLEPLADRSLAALNQHMRD